MSYQLVIAEKPSVARSIAGVIGADKKQDGYMEGNGYLVSWCIGHLVSLADAGTYDERFKKWRYDDLPILPQEWQYIIPDDKKKQFDTLRSLMERPDVTGLVCATDAGREGELIFRFVYALLVSFAAVTLLSAVIIFLVAGLTRKGAAAFSGAIAGVFASSLLAYVFTHLFKINGAVMPYSQSLLYSGYEFLSLSDIYIGAIFLSSSGAVMDLAMDVAAGMEEVRLKQPGISRRELMQSGLRIGRSVAGTMTTTLLLAYSGGYLTLMMTFAAQGTSPADFINNPYVASEAVKTIIGSFGLVLVAPLTAALGAAILSRRSS